MSQSRLAIPEVDIPINSRETILRKKDMFWLNLRLSILPVAFTVILALECIIFSTMYLYAPQDLFFISLSEYLTVIIVVSIFYAFICVLTLRSLVFRKMKLYGIPIVYGFTRDVFYAANVFAQSVSRWEFYTAWKETGGYFLLCAQNQWIILPKGIWTAGELEELRAAIREKAGKAYAPGSGGCLR